MKMTEKNKGRINLMLTILLMALCFALGGIGVNASTKSDMNKTVKYFCKGNYKEAAKYNNTKLPEYASEACVKKMSKKMKAAYRKAIKKEYPKYKNIREEYGCCYYTLTDMDNDNKAELIVSHATRHGSHLDLVYDYQGGKAVKLGQYGITFGEDVNSYPGHKGLLYTGTHGMIGMTLVTFKGGKAHVKKLSNYVDSSKCNIDYIKNRLKVYYVYNPKKIGGPLK